MWFGLIARIELIRCAIGIIYLMHWRVDSVAVSKDPIKMTFAFDGW